MLIVKEDGVSDSAEAGDGAASAVLDGRHRGLHNHAAG